MNKDFLFEQYTTWIFDCDGVVLNSNRIKTEAFYLATLPYGQEAAKAMVKYHIANGGVSRYQKFSHFVTQIAPEYAAGQRSPKLDDLLQKYADHVREGLLCCDVAEGLEELRLRTSNANWLIVSGGDQNELRDVFAKRGLAEWFDGGIYGSPDTKDAILIRELTSGNITKPAIFLGDSEYDYAAASRAGLDFLFLSRWTEFDQWEYFFRDKDAVVSETISNLLS